MSVRAEVWRERRSSTAVVADDKRVTALCAGGEVAPQRDEVADGVLRAGRRRQPDLRRWRRREFIKVNSEPAVSLYQKRLEQSRCTRCGVEVSSGNELCDEHAEDKRARQKRWQAEERVRRRTLGLCLYCPKSGGIAPAVDGGSSCLRCRVQRNRLRSSNRVQGPIDTAATKQTATCYRRKGKRGRQSRLELDAQDLRQAREMLIAAERGLGVLDTDEFRSMGWAERTKIEVAACSHVDRAMRFLAEVLARHPCFEEQAESYGRRGGVLNGPVEVPSSRKG